MIALTRRRSTETWWCSRAAPSCSAGGSPSWRLTRPRLSSNASSRAPTRSPRLVRVDAGRDRDDDDPAWIAALPTRGRSGDGLRGSRRNDGLRCRRARSLRLRPRLRRPRPTVVHRGVQSLQFTAVATGMTAARAAGVKTSAGKRALRLRHDALTAARSLLCPGQLRPQTRVLGTRRGHLGPQARDLVLPRVVVHARLSRGMRPQQIAVRLGDGNDLFGEGILPEHPADLVFDLPAIESDVLLGLRERPIDRGASTRLAVPLSHRLVHQVGVGALL